jgi:hypothetical protein
MLNRDVFCRDIAIIVKIIVPYNAFQGNNSKKLTGLEIFLNPFVSVGKSSKFHRPGRNDPNFLKILKLSNQCLIPTYFVEIQRFL